MSRPARTEAGAIYDIGYQHYDGPRLGRSYAVRSLFAHGLRSVLAFGRGGKAQAIPIGLAVLAFAPAVVQALVVTYAEVISEVEVLTYANYVGMSSMIYLLFCASRAPELVSADQRTRTLVLYFSRALHRGDYVAARVLALFSVLLFLMVGPQLVLMGGRVFASAEPWSVFREEASELVPIFLTSGVSALALSTLGTAIASLTPRRGLAATGVLGFFLLTTAVAGILSNTVDGPAGRWLLLVNPILALLGFTTWVFDAPAPADLPYPFVPGWGFALVSAGFIALAVGVLWARYRRIGE